MQAPENYKPPTISALGDYALEIDDMPMFGGSRMPIPYFETAIASCLWFDIDGRLLMPEETLGLVCSHYGLSVPPSKFSLYNKLENPDATLEWKLAKFTQSDRDKLTAPLLDAYKTYLNQDQVAKFRAADLNGL